MIGRSALVAFGLAMLACSVAHATRTMPDKLRLPSVGMIGLDASGAAALISRQIAPPPPVGPPPVRKLRFVRSTAAVPSR